MPPPHHLPDPRSLVPQHSPRSVGIEGVAELGAALRLAADVAQAPMAILVLGGEGEVREIAHHGFVTPPAALANALGNAASGLDDPLVVPDLWLDPRFSDQARATGDARVRSGVAVNLKVPGQAPVALCVLDRRVRDFDAGQLGALADVVVLARHWFEARRATRDARDERSCSQALVLNVGEALRPQLDIVMGYSQVLLLDTGAALAPPALRHFDKLRQAAQRVGKLFDDLTRLIRAQVARPGSPQDAARSCGVDLDVVARHAIALHETQAREAGVSLRHIAWPEPVHADADLSAALQVISELLANGIAFNLRDATLTLETSVRDDRACLAFTDEGLGFAESQRARLFAPIERPAGPGTGLDAGRSGLGLVIARAMACAMGGEIRVDSRPGAGSTFTLELPLQRSAPTPAPPPVDPAEAPHERA